jgi:hypothetical protein
MVRNNHQREKISSKEAAYDNPGFSYLSVQEETLLHEKEG